MPLIALLFLLGIFAGAVAGFFGVGGGLLFTPILFFVFSGAGVESPETWAIASALFCTFIASVSSSIQQNRQKNTFLKEGIATGVFGAFGVYAGKQIVTSDFFTEDVFVSLFVVLLVFVSILFYRKSRAKVTLQVKAGVMGWLKMLFAGGCGGFVASIAGVGGGVILVPVMNLWYRLPIAKAVSISSLAIVMISFSGWVQYAFFADGGTGASAYATGFVDFGTSLPLVIGAFLGGLAGVKMNEKVKAESVQLGFSILVILIALSLIWSQL
jgi:uncharacterized membrane protein YfcA